MQVELTAARVAKNQSTFRGANEEIEQAAARIDPGRKTTPYVCECPLPSCMSIEKLSFSEYELVRSQGDWFFVIIGHEVCIIDDEEVARIARRESHFSIMQKVGRAGEIARELDPRD